MKKKKLALIGTRGMVGQVLLERMRQEGDLKNLEVSYFSTTQQGHKVLGLEDTYQNALDTSLLRQNDVIITCQGSSYTEEIHPLLRQSGWAGFWIDASKALRQKSSTRLLLDPLNRPMIEEGIKQGIKDFAGANCTVSLMLLAIKGLLDQDLVEWITAMTYQAASGAGAQAMLDLGWEMKELSDSCLGENALEFESNLRHKAQSFERVSTLGAPLACNLLPWIDGEEKNGQSTEEWKGENEAKLIMGKNWKVKGPDGTCVRVPSLRAHSQALTIKLKKNVALSEIEELIKGAHPWIKWVDNNKASSLKELNPLSVSGKLDIAVGRVRKMSLGEDFLNLFTVGDQLLWGAAEPLRRGLQIILQNM